MPKKYDHFHKYERLQLGSKGYVIFRCRRPDCSHTIRKELVKGKIAACNRCDEPFIMTAHEMRMQLPHCKACTKRRDEIVDKLAELFK